MALALHGLCMRQGPDVFADAVRIANKLGVSQVLEEYSKSWSAFAQEQSVPGAGITSLSDSMNSAMKN